MTLPLAAPPTSPTPGFWLTVDLKAAPISPGSQPLKLLIVAPKNTTGGDMTANTEIRDINSQAEVETAGGTGSLPSLAYAAALRRCKTLQCRLICPAESGGNAASGTVTASGTITTDGTVRYIVSGHIVDVPWLVGENAAAHHTKAVTYIGRYADKLLCTAAVDAAVKLTANVKGPCGNDITLRAFILEGCASGTITPSGGTLTGGTTEPDFTTALANIHGEQFDEILLCLSNADAVSTTGNLAKAKTTVNSLNTGNAAKLQQVICGHTGTRSAAVVNSASLNDQVIELLNAQNAESLPCEFGGEEAGDRIYCRSIGKLKRIGTTYPDLFGSPNPITDNPTTAQSDAALLAGLSIIGYADNGACSLIRGITTYCLTETSEQVLPTDTNEIDVMYDWAKDMRAALPVEFQDVNGIIDDLEEGDEELPEGIAECRDVKAFIISRTEAYWIPKGRILGAQFKADVESGALAVQINSTDEGQVDIYVPLHPIKVLSKFGVYAAKI